MTLLARGRSRAESRMATDGCTITRPTAADDAWDAAAGSYTPAAAPVIYTGPCRVRNSAANPQAADAGEALWAADLIYVHLPVAGSGQVRDGDLVTITACQNDPSAVGREATVEGLHFQTNSTARRLPCRLVTRDG